jgi:hypothetical protein
MQGNYVKQLHPQVCELGKRGRRASSWALRARLSHTDFHSMSGVVLVFGVRADLAHVRDAEAVVAEIDADEGLADRDRDGDRDRVEGVPEAVGDQFAASRSTSSAAGCPSAACRTKCRADGASQMCRGNVLVLTCSCTPARCCPHRRVPLPAVRVRHWS